jgi:hypothetical protein
VPLTGGPVSVQTVPGRYALTAWPWLTSAIGDLGGPADLYNARTGQRLAVPLGQDQQATCTPTWCRIISSSANQRTIELRRPDGRDNRRISRTGHAEAVADVAIRDRFELLTTTSPATGSPTNSETLSLYDLKTRRQITLSPAVNGIYTRGDWLWWSTGDNETLTWHLLELTTLR